MRKPQSFRATTSREVLRKVREALGEDALIVTNRAVADGVEVTALPAAALAAPRAETARAETPAPDGIVQQLMAEVKAMKAAMQRELAGIAWSDLMRRDPAHGALMRSLLEAGFSPALARELVAAVPANGDAAAAHKAAGVEIGRRLALAAGDAPVVKGGVYALVGPTGVGKTTTTAKLAARCVVRHGAGQLALVTTDAYRIGAHEQLRVYGRILGVQAHLVRDAEDLRATLDGLRGKKTVLIDTIGMSQRDRAVAEQAALLAAGGAEVKRLLLLAATSNAATLDEVIAAYGSGGLHGCIVTKVDEAAGLAPALDCVIRHRLPLAYVTNGQRVPEDLHLPNPAYLVHRALRALTADSAHDLAGDAFPLLAGTAAQGAAHG